VHLKNFNRPAQAAVQVRSRRALQRAQQRRTTCRAGAEPAQMRRPRRCAGCTAAHAARAAAAAAARRELRAEIVHLVSKTGGHLSSSLGVMELADAQLPLRCSTREDKVIWTWATRPTCTRS
jgi:hypothetical protein